MTVRAGAAQVQVLLWRWGWAWPLAAALVAAVAAVFTALLAPAHERLARARGELASAAAGARAQPVGAAPASEQEQLAALRANLDAPTDAAELIGRLHALARAERITLAQGEYRQQMHADTGLLQLQVTQPIKAGYPQLKRYIEAVLHSMPYASLEQITARRESVTQAQLEVRLRWSFWCYQPPAASSTSFAEGRRP